MSNSQSQQALVHLSVERMCVYMCTRVHVCTRCMKACTHVSCWKGPMGCPFNSHFLNEGTGCSEPESPCTNLCCFPIPHSGPCTVESSNSEPTILLLPQVLGSTLLIGGRCCCLHFTDGETEVQGYSDWPKVPASGRARAGIQDRIGLTSSSKS